MVSEPLAGRPPFAAVWVVTYPLLITYLTQKVLTTVDTALLGRFSTRALASAGLAAPVYIVATVVAVGWPTATGVAELPEGLNTVVGERGATLSGGQRQRIAIARALPKNAPILIMDEAVSSLDTENEQALHAAMAEVRRGRTTLLIAHRLSTIRSANLIVTLDNGRVAETGRYDDLVRAGESFARLIAAQHRGSLER